jgi:hypothetical protein
MGIWSDFYSSAKINVKIATPGRGAFSDEENELQNMFCLAGGGNWDFSYLNI